MKTVFRTITLTILAAVVMPASIVLADTQLQDAGERVPSRYDAPTLPAFEIDQDKLGTDEMKRRVEHALRSVAAAGTRGTTLDLNNIQFTDADDDTVFGTVGSDESLEFAAQPSLGRLDIVNRAAQELELDPDGISEENAVKKALDLIDALHDGSVLDKFEFDRQQLSIAAHKQGSGALDQPIDPANELTVDYRITAKRQLNGVPVVGSYVRVVVHNSGEVSELNISSRPLKTTTVGNSHLPAGRGANIGIDRSADEAREMLETRMQLGPQDQLHVERWSLAYIDAPTKNQKFYQPAYVFLVTPLTETEEGVLAARKLVRVIPASRTALEAMPFDPLGEDTGASPAGDVRRAQTKSSKP